MKLTPTQQQTVEENHNLIYKYMQVHHLPKDDYPNDPGEDSPYEILVDALITAVLTYDTTKETHLSTYIFKCFDNAMARVATRKKRQKRNSICRSLDEMIIQDNDYPETYGDIVGIDDSEDNIYNINMSIFTDKLTRREKDVMHPLLKYGNHISNTDIAQTLHCTPAYVGQVIHNIRGKYNEYMEG